MEHELSKEEIANVLNVKEKKHKNTNRTNIIRIPFGINVILTACETFKYMRDFDIIRYLLDINLQLLLWKSIVYSIFSFICRKNV